METLRLCRWRLVCLLLGLALVAVGPGYAGVKRDCRWLLDGSRSERNLTSDRIETVVARVWQDRLIRQLEQEHLEAFSNRHLKGPIAWRAFSPTWVLNSPSTLNQVLEYFDPSDGSQPEFGGTVLQWIALWEKGYQDHIGPLAPSWERTNRRRFLQKLLVEGAVRYALREGLHRPEAFVSEWHEIFPSYSPLGTGIGVAFKDDVGLFQKEFDRVFRRRTGERLNASSASVPAHEAQVRAGLRSVGVDVQAIRGWQPVVSASFRERTRDQDVQLVVESVRASGNPSTGIFALLQESTGVSDGHEQTGFATASLNAALERAGSVNKFFGLVNSALVAEDLPEIGPSQGTKNLAEEVVIQMALYSWVHVHGNAIFQGFQALDAEEPFYFEMGSDLVQRSRLTMARINSLVSRRVISLGMNSSFIE